MSIRLLVVATLGLQVFVGAHACDYCLVSQGISPLDTVKGRGVRITQRYTVLDSVYDGEDEIVNPGAEERYYTTELSAFWSPLPRVTLIGVLPLRVTEIDGHLAHAHEEDEAEGDEDHHDEEDDHEDEDHEHPASPALDNVRGGDEGIGDIALLARFKAFERHTLTATTTVAVLGGIKVASGATDGRADNGEFLDAHVQLGTGSTDGLVGVSAQHAHGRWSLVVNALAAVKGEGEAGTMDYEYGDSLNYDMNLRYRMQPAVVGGGPNQTFLSLGLSGELRDVEQAAGVDLDDSGGHVVFIQPGLQHQWGSRVILEVAAHVPVHYSLRGTQLGDDLKLLGSATFLF